MFEFQIFLPLFFFFPFKVSTSIFSVVNANLWQKHMDDLCLNIQLKSCICIFTLLCFYLLCILYQEKFWLLPNDYQNLFLNRSLIKIPVTCLVYLTCFLLAFKYRLILYCLGLTILILLKCYIQLYPCNLIDIFGHDCVSEMKLLLLCYCCIRNTNLDNPKMHIYQCLSDSEGLCQVFRLWKQLGGERYLGRVIHCSSKTDQWSLPQLAIRSGSCESDCLLCLRFLPEESLFSTGYSKWKNKDKKVCWISPGIANT